MKKFIYIVLVILFATSCDDWFDAAPKVPEMDEDTLFESESAFRNAMNGVYAQLRSQSLYGSHLTLGGIEFLGQNLVPDSELEEWTQFNYESDFAKQLTSEVLDSMYSTIYSCNNLLQLLESKKNVNFVAGSREVMIAEMKALRAYMHYDLLRVFHPSYVVDKNFKGIYWVTSTKEGSKEQLSTDEMMKRILADLDQSIEVLAKYDPVVTDVSLDTKVLYGMRAKDRFWKMNYFATLGIKARVSMSLDTKEGYSAALAAAKTIIDSEKYPFLLVISTDLAFSTENIFTLSSDNSDFRNLSIDLFSNRAIKVAAHLGLDDLKTNSFDEKRLKWYSPDLTSLSPKYGEGSIIANWRLPQGIPVIKIGEIYLIAAEAALKLDESNPQVGFAYLNKLLTDRYFEVTLTSSSDVRDMLDEIENQYRYEFVGEGQLFFYHKRKNKNSILKYDGSMMTMSNEQYTIPMFNW